MTAGRETRTPRDPYPGEGYPPRFPVRLSTLPIDPRRDASRAPALAAVLGANLRAVRGRIAAAVAPGGAAPVLLPVTKSVPPETALVLARMLAAERPGPVDLAESRATELARKAQHLRAAGIPVRWHFVGHVQRNKARRVAELADVVHSLDSLRLAETLEAAAAAAGKVLAVYVQVDFTGEPTKSGLDAGGAREVLAYAARAPHLAPLGLMAMGPLHEVPGRTTRDVFLQTAALARELEADPAVGAGLPDGRARLSLGMSADLEQAVAAGSTLVRVGSDLFRDLPDGREPGGADSTP